MKFTPPNTIEYTEEEAKGMGPFDNIEIQVSMRNKKVVSFIRTTLHGTNQEIHPEIVHAWVEKDTIGQVAGTVLGAALDKGLLSPAKALTVKILDLDVK
jgi:hypothetical protein